MLRFQPFDVVGVRTDVARVDRLRENVCDALLSKLALLKPREVRCALEEAFHFRL